MNEVPDSLPVTDEAKRATARAGEPAAGCDRDPPDRPARGCGRRHAPGRRSAAAAGARARQGDARRRPTSRASRWLSGSSGWSRELRSGRAARHPTRPRNRLRAPPQPTRPPAPIAVELEQLQEAWRRSILPAVEQRSIPIGKTLGEAHPAALDGDTLTLEFPQTASFHLQLAEDPKNAALLRDALYEVTGRKLAVTFELGDPSHDEPDDDAPASEEDVLELMKSTFDARELDE